MSRREIALFFSDLIFLNILITISDSLIRSIYGFYYLVKYNNIATLKYCPMLHNSITLSSTYGIVEFIFVLIFLIFKLKYHDYAAYTTYEKNIFNSKLLTFITFTKTLILLISMGIIYRGGEYPLCHNEWIKVTPELWNIVNYNYHLILLGFILFSILLLGCLLKLFCYCFDIKCSNYCKSIRYDEDEHNNDHDNSINSETTRLIHPIV